MGQMVRFGLVATTGTPLPVVTIGRTLPGRGAWICSQLPAGSATETPVLDPIPRRECVAKAHSTGAFSRAFRQPCAPSSGGADAG